MVTAEICKTLPRHPAPVTSSSRQHRLAPTIRRQRRVLRLFPGLTRKRVVCGQRRQGGRHYTQALWTIRWPRLPPPHGPGTGRLAAVGGTRTRGADRPCVKSLTTSGLGNRAIGRSCRRASTALKTSAVTWTRSMASASLSWRSRGAVVAIRLHRAAGGDVDPTGAIASRPKGGLMKLGHERRRPPGAWPAHHVVSTMWLQGREAARTERFWVGLSAHRPGVGRPSRRRPGEETAGLRRARRRAGGHVDGAETKGGRQRTSPKANCDRYTTARTPRRCCW